MIETKHIFRKIYDNGNSGSAFSINCLNGDRQILTLSDDCDITIVNPIIGEYKIYLKENGTGGYDPTWITSISWDKNVEPTWITIADAVNIVVLDYDGTTWRGSGWTPA
jgi:hypothetical protein